MNPIVYCPRCGARMFPENVGEWACFTCGELLFVLSTVDLRIAELQKLAPHQVLRRQAA